MKKTILVLLLVLGKYYCMANKKNLAADNAKFSISRSFIADTLNSNAQIPIIAWLGVPQGETTLARYQELKASGITESFSRFTDADKMQAALDIAQKAGIKLFVACPELGRDPEGTVRRFMNHPALAGYYLADEPGGDKFAGLGAWVKRIRAIDDKHICYINLLPIYGSPKQYGAQSYQEYLDKYISNVPAQILSFDHYPISGLSKPVARSDWFKNLEMIANESKQANKPFYAFALTTAFASYPVPTLESLRLQVYSNLAYGAQGIQYFTYWTASDGGLHNFNNAPMSMDGNKTDVYYKIQQLNKEIKNLSPVFFGAKVRSVTHTGDKIPPGTTPLTQLPKPIRSLKTNGMGAVVSVMENKGNTYLVIVNRDFTDSMDLTMSCAGGVSKVAKDGSSSALSQKTSKVKVEPGDAVIYRWSDSLN